MDGQVPSVCVSYCQRSPAVILVPSSTLPISLDLYPMTEETS